MTTRKKTNKFIFSIFMLALAVCLAFSGQQLLVGQQVFAYQTESSEVTLTNADFNSSTSTYLQSSPSGWTSVDSSSGKAGVITTKESDFKNRASSYALESTKNPGKPYTTSAYPLDDHVLMINAKSSTSTNESNNQGYKSNAISLSAYGFYRVSVWAKTQDGAFASMYLTGFDDKTENTSFETIENRGWQEYRFYVATGIDTKSVNIELWLGTKTQGSYNAVFFDHISATQLSENYFTDEVNAITNNKTNNVIDLRDYASPLITNANFENAKDGWTVIDYLPLNANAKVFNVTTPSGAPTEKLKNAGSSLTANNNYAFALYSEQKTAFGYKSTSFKINPYETYKISFFAKTIDLDGSATVVLKEGNDVLDFYNLDAEDEDNFYTPTSSTLTLASNSTNQLTNNYTLYNFYVKGHPLYTTSLSIELWLGSEENNASGYVIFDDFRFEKISHTQFDNASTTNAQKLTLNTLTGTPSVKNGTFNNVEALDKDFSYPLTPSDWTHKSQNDQAKYGIVNTNSNTEYSFAFENNNDKFGGIFNPQNPNPLVSTNSESNNILMMYNSAETYQSVTSSSLSLSADKYYQISFNFRTVQQTANQQILNVYLIDSDSNVVYSDLGVYSQDWAKYNVLVKTNNNASTLSLVLEVGTEQNPVRAYVFVDNVNFYENTTMTDELYKTYVQANNYLDFSVGSFNIISEEKDEKSSMYEAYRYTASLDMGTNPSNANPVAFGGIVDGSDTENEYGITNSPNNNNALKFMPAIRVNGKATYSLTAKDSIKLASDTYYKVSIDVLTRFVEEVDQSTLEEEKRATYGANFELVGLENSFKEIKTNGEWTTYTTYVKATTETSVNLKFSATSTSNDVKGIAFFDNLVIETIEELDFVNAENFEDDGKTLIIGSTDETEEETPDDENKDNDTNLATSLMYIIPSLILAVSLVVALVAYFMKKVKIKKWEKKKINEYDREQTLHRDVVRQEAEKQRQSDIAEVNAQIAELEKELERIEEINKERLKQQRTRETKGITRQDEKEFKAYASRHTKIENNITALKEKIDNMNTPEYVLAIQRKIIVEKVRAEKEAKKLNNK